jgi:hypothetical protein
VASLSSLVETTDDAGAPVRLGDCVLSPVATRGDVTGPTAVELVGGEPGTSRELDPVIAHGVGICLRPR